MDFDPLEYGKGEDSWASVAFRSLGRLRCPTGKLVVQSGITDLKARRDDVAQAGPSK